MIISIVRHCSNKPEVDIRSTYNISDATNFLSFNPIHHKSRYFDLKTICNAQCERTRLLDVSPVLAIKFEN